MGWYAGLGARLVDTVRARPCRSRRRSPRGSAIPRRASTTAGTGRCRRRGRPRRTRSPGSTSRVSCARTRSRRRPGGRADHSPTPPRHSTPPRSRTPTARSATGGFASRFANRVRATCTSSCATTRAAPTSCSRPPTPPGRPTTGTAGTAPTGGSIRSHPRQHGGPPRAYKVSYNRPARDPPLPGGEHGVQLGVPVRAVPGGERLRHDLHDRRPTATGAASSSRNHRPLSFRRARRVLVRASAAQRRGGARRGCPTSGSSAATRCSGRTRFEPGIDAGGEPHRTLVTYKETPRQRQDRPGARGVDRHLARLACVSTPKGRSRRMR